MGRIAVPKVIAILLLFLAVAGVRVGIEICMQDLDYTRAQTEVSFWGRGTYQPGEKAIADTGDILQELLRAAPEQPEFLELQAHYLIWKAFWSADLEERDVLGRQAVDTQRRALLSRPANRQGWVKMLEYASRISSGEEMLRVAQQRQASLLPRQN